MLTTHCTQALGAVLKAGAAELSPAHAIDAAWGLAIVGGADKVRQEYSYTEELQRCLGLRALALRMLPAWWRVAWELASQVSCMQHSAQAWDVQCCWNHVLWVVLLLSQDAVSALFGAASKAIEAAPDSVDPYQVCMGWQIHKSTTDLHAQRFNRPADTVWSSLCGCRALHGFASCTPHQ